MREQKRYRYEWMKRFLSMLLVQIMVLSSFSMEFVIKPITVEAATLNYAQLKEKFPAGKYWNHANNIGSGYNNQDGWTTIPCSKHGTTNTSKETCNGFSPNGTKLSWQCMGFAEKLGYDATGLNPRNSTAGGWQTYTSVSALNSLKPGDIVRYKNNGHSIYITAVNGDNITYADCNSDGHCIIRWDIHISKSTLANTFTYVRSAPFALDGTTVVSCDCSDSYAGNYTCTTTSANLVIRSGHGSSYSSLGSIPSGATVYVSKANGSWAHVEYNGVSGYASMQYLSKQQETTVNVPWGHVDGIGGGLGCINIYGWAVDADDLSQALDIHVYIGGEAGADVPCYVIHADQYRSDVDINTPFGGYHGYSETIYTYQTGEQKVCIYGINIGNGYNTLLGEFTVNIEADTEAPQITDVCVTDITPEGYTVKGKVTDNAKLSHISLPTWSAVNGQDDIMWDSIGCADNTEYDFSYRVNISDHKNDSGWYATHIYAYDRVGNSSGYSVDANVPKASYQILYNANGGSDAPAAQTKQWEQALKLSTNVPSRRGYDFLGWSTDQDATAVEYTSGSNYTVDEDVTLYAVWKKKTYIILYNANGGTGAPSSQTKTHGTNLTLSSTGPTRTGYTFTGWNTKADGSGISYAKGGNYIADEAVTLYAQWKKNAADLPFTDVKKGTWQYTVARYVYERNIMTGTSTTKFSPGMALTRGQLVNILWRMEGCQSVSYKTTFPDVPDGKYYTKAVLWANSKGIVNGYKTGLFGPSNDVTRQDFIVILYNYARYKGYSTATSGTTYTECSDYKQVSSYAKTAIEWAYERGLIGANGTLNPKGNASRIEAAAMLQRFLEYYGQ